MFHLFPSNLGRLACCHSQWVNGTAPAHVLTRRRGRVCDLLSLEDNGARLVFRSDLPFNRLYSFLERLRGDFRIQGRVEIVMDIPEDRWLKAHSWIWEKGEDHYRRDCAACCCTTAPGSQSGIAGSPERVSAEGIQNRPICCWL